MKNDIVGVLLTEKQIKQKVKELGEQITKDFWGKNLVLIAVLKGSVVFMTDLMREIDLPLELDFMAVSSYGTSSKTTGVVKIIKDLDISITDKDVIIVEDIIDSGITLKYLTEVFAVRNVRSLKICALMNKPNRRKADVKVDYIGFTIPDEFVVGYGLDYAGKYRNLPCVGILKRELYE